jgi:hypothetical protein
VAAVAAAVAAATATESAEEGPEDAVAEEEPAPGSLLRLMLSATDAATTEDKNKKH